MTLPNGQPEYNFIFENVEIVSNDQLHILEESKTTTGERKVKFRTKLQEAEVVNKNKRRYSQNICESIVNQLQIKAKSNSLLSELNHPMSGNAEELKRRATIIDYNNCCAKIEDIKFKDNFIIGELSTLSSFKGPDLAKLIVDDKVDIGFSLRALGSIKPIAKGILEVSSPIYAVSYDVVSNPSHANSKIIEFLPESNANHMFEQDQLVLCENVEVGILEADNVSIAKKNIGMSVFLDDIIRESFCKNISKNILFRF